MQTVLERFLRYVKVDTQSQPDRDTIPSTQKQLDLAVMLEQELREMGASQVRRDQHGYVYATIPATREGGVSLGFLAHMDTSCAVSGAQVKPRVVTSYDGGEILLNEAEGIRLCPKEFPELLHYVGEDLVVTDGTTLLGADDKAGIAEIMTMAQTLLENPQIPHGPVQIAFTPDEEVGRGVECFDVEGFGAQFAYTVDGGEWGEIEYENFNAAALRLKLHGKSIHTGSARGKMRNALLLAMEFHQMLPAFQNPACTSDREGFFHLDRLEGGVEEATADYIIRDHDKDLFQQKKQLVLDACEYLNRKYGCVVAQPCITDTYYNMKEQIEPHIHLIENATEVMQQMGTKPIIIPVRGGTDGAQLSYKGLPCPNLCTGGHNCHGRMEYVSVQSMEKVVKLLLGIVEKYSDFSVG